jgi:hypothetical protein
MFCYEDAVHDHDRRAANSYRWALQTIGATTAPFLMANSDKLARVVTHLLSRAKGMPVGASAFGQRPALLRATVVKFGDPRFTELDGKYLSGCNNPLVKSAIPKS